MFLALFIIFLILGVGVFTYLFVQIVRKIKDETSNELNKKDFFNFLIPLFAVGLFTIFSNIFLGYYLEWQFTATEIVFLIFGSYLFALFITYFICTFALYYYKPKLEFPNRKYLYYGLAPSFIFAILSLFLMLEGMANHFDYPLVSGISIGSLNIQFYGILIVTGAVICYFIADHELYKKYKKHGLVDPVFLICFPMGVIGARLWYCLVLESNYYLSNPIEILYIWQGGLAVQGGVLLGITSGILAMLFFRRYVNIRWAMDFIIPSILIAQAIGRFGNFFNQEVYGAIADISNWQFLPTFIVNQMMIGGSLRVPLFLIEALTNLAGYFIIRFVIGRLLKKWLSLGDLAACYLIWYGLTRITMEYMRSSAYAYSTSYMVAYLFLAGGILLIIAFHLYDYIRKVKGLPPKNLDTI